MELKHQFPKAQVIIDSITNVKFHQRFDVILMSQVLYYIPKWFELCQTLFEQLNPQGLLILVMNPDSGDWWKVVHTFKSTLGRESQFFYQPWSIFRMSLAQLGPLESIQYQYEVNYNSYALVSEAIGKQILQITQEEVFAAFQSQFLEFAQKEFPQSNSLIRLHVDGELTIVKAENGISFHQVE